MYSEKYVHVSLLFVVPDFHYIELDRVSFILVPREYIYSYDDTKYVFLWRGQYVEDPHTEASKPNKTILMAQITRTTRFHRTIIPVTTV